MSGLWFRDARGDDVPVLVRLYADDALGAARESPVDPLPEEYLTAFRRIDASPDHRLVVAEQDGEVVGTLQLSFVPHLVRRGGERAQLEGVRVRSDRRGRQVGRELVAWAVEQARERGCLLVELTTDASRTDAQRFYASLGFTASHVGMKLLLREG